MAPEIRVGRYFHFSCSCGTTTITGQSNVICRRCGNSLAVRRVRKQQRIPGGSVYYGVVLSTGQHQPASSGSPQPAEADVSREKQPVMGILSLVRVGRFKPDGITPHPHAGAVGQVMDIFNDHAHVVVAGGRYGICVSVSCLEAASRQARCSRGASS